MLPLACMPLVLGAANWYHAAATLQGIALNGSSLVQLLLVYYSSQLLNHFMLVSCYFRMDREIDEMWKDRRVCMAVSLRALVRFRVAAGLHYI